MWQRMLISALPPGWQVARLEPAIQPTLHTFMPIYREGQHPLAYTLCGLAFSRARLDLEVENIPWCENCLHDTMAYAALNPEWQTETLQVVLAAYLESEADTVSGLVQDLSPGQRRELWRALHAEGLI